MHSQNAWVAPRPEQEIEAGTGILHSYSALDRGGCRAGLHRYQSRESALLDGRHQRTVSPLPSRRNPNRRFG